MSNLERKFGKYAISNLTVILLGCYVVGYVIQMVLPGLFQYLTLNPYMIFKGQIWRILTWVLVPPTSLTSSLDAFLVVIMLLFYYSLGTNLERAWGTWRYNVYIFRGIGITVLFSIVVTGIYLLLLGGSNASYLASFLSAGAMFYSTYYINMSIFLAYAMTYSNAQVLLMFVIPVRVKWLGILYGVMLVFEMVQAFFALNWFTVAAIAASLLNFAVFYFQVKRHISPKQIRRRVQFQNEIRRNPSPSSGHKCAICGQTDAMNDKLEFRYCSKCNGNFEYCQEHLFTHEHVK